MQHTLALIFAIFSFVASQDLDGCPIYGCRPSGTFSFQLKVPHSNASVHWVSQFFIGPVPNVQGCVSNSEQLICQSNGPAGDDTGYMSLSPDSGKLRWRDPILRFPALPLLSTSGDVIGSDGNNLVHYDKDGKPMTSIIKLDPDMRPIFSLQLVGDDLILLVSETGQIALRATGGRPVAELFLNATVERANGIFIPVASPVSNGNRIYLLTEFLPDTGQWDSVSVLGLQRLYAIDVFDRMADRVKIAWYANFEREGKTTKTHKLKFRSHSLRHRLLTKIKSQQALLKASLLWYNEARTVFVSLPPPELNPLSTTMSSFWGIRDNGNSAEYVFHSIISVTNMALFEPSVFLRQSSGNALRKYNDIQKSYIPNSDEIDSQDMAGKGTGLASANTPNAGAQLWVSLDDGRICAVERDGNISKTIDLPAILKTEFEITSKMVTTRNTPYDEDILIFGIRISNASSNFNDYLLKRGIVLTNATAFLLALDTPINTATVQQPLVWLVPTPDNTAVRGQIVGIKGAGDKPDQLIYFSQTDGQFAKIVSVI